MIDLGSIGGLHAHDHELHAYCIRCDHWSAIDLEALVQAGQGERRLPLTIRCRICGEVGQLQVRPPMPRWTNTGGWISAKP